MDMEEMVVRVEVHQVILTATEVEMEQELPDKVMLEDLL
jgi:hypothetical protein